MMYLSNFQKFTNFSMCSNHLANNVNAGNTIKIFDAAGVEGDATVPE